MRYYDLILNGAQVVSAGICCLNDRDSAYELADILRACVRTYITTKYASDADIDIHSVSITVEQDFNHDDDCGSFRVCNLTQVDAGLAKILDYEMDRFIKERDLWTDRSPEIKC